MSREVDQAITIGDLKRIAQRHLPDFAFMPAEVGTGGGAGPVQNVASFGRHRLIPRVAEEAVEVQLRTEILGKSYDLPFGISAIGYAGKMRSGADIALAEAAAEANIPFLISGGSVTPLEAVVKVAPGQVWQQLYAARDDAITDDFIGRGIDCGREVLVLTIDMPTPPSPDWSPQRGIMLPVAVRREAWPQFLWQLATHPRWCFAHARAGGMPKLESWAKYAPERSGPAGLYRFLQSQLLTQMTWHRIERLRRRWPGKFVVKGILHPDDVRRAVAAGADAVTISNHGGNKLESAIAPLDALDAIDGALGAEREAPLFFDGGIRNGADLVVARALGADVSFVGRAALYGVMAGGRAGASKAIAILRSQLERTLLHLGKGSLAHVDRTVLHH